MTIFSRWFNYFWPRDVIFGRKPLVGVGNVGLAHHWAIKVNLIQYCLDLRKPDLRKNLDLRKPDIKRNLDLRKIVTTTDF